MSRLLVYADTQWAIGQLHAGLARVMRTRDWAVDLRHYAATWEELDAIVRETASCDRVMAIPGGNAQTLLDRGVPPEKMVLVAHAEIDLVNHINTYGSGKSLDGYRGYGVVSDTLASTSLTLGITRIPTVLRMGVDCDRYRHPPARELRRIGYGTVPLKWSWHGINIKRGHIAQQCALDAGLEFVSAYEQTGRPAIQPFAEMPAFYASVDAVLCPSLQEGAGLPMLEAAAAGRLTIVTPTGHFTRLAYEGLGILGPLGECEFRQFATAQLKFYKDNPTAFADKCASLQTAAQKRDWSIVACDWIEYLT